MEKKRSALDIIRSQYRPSPKPVFYTESEVQASVIKRYEENGWLVVKIIQTTLNGWPDLQCIKDGKTIYVECKATGEKPKPLQLYRHRQLRDYGCEVLVIDTKI